MAFIALGVYALIIFTTSRSAAGCSKEAFYVNNRASSAWAIGFSIFVSCVGASATIGMIGLAFTVGTPAFWWLGSGAIGLTTLSLLLARAVRRSGAYTLPQMTENFLGQAARPLIAVCIVTAWVAILAAQFTALCTVLASLTGFGPYLCLAVSLLLICGHTAGGQSAIMRVDGIQALIILAALATMLVWLCLHNAEWTQHVRFEWKNEHFPIEKLRYFLVVIGANYLVCPMLFGRLLSAKNEKSAVAGGLIGAAGIVACSVLIVSVGLACKGLIPHDTAQDAVLATLLANVLPPWMHIVVGLALVSAIVSSADSCLITAATVCSHDIFQKTAPSVARICVALLGLAGAALSLWGQGIIGFLLMAYDIFACGVVVPCVIGLCAFPKRRVNTRAACAAVVAGGIFGAAAALTQDSTFSYLGMGISGGLTVMGLQKKPACDVAKS